MIMCHIVNAVNYKIRVGTPGYMAPEIENGRGPCTAAVDSWGLGCVLFNL